MYVNVNVKYCLVGLRYQHPKIFCYDLLGGFAPQTPLPVANISVVSNGRAVTLLAGLNV